MFESFLAVPLHFTIEFLGFLVAVGAALLVITRPELIPGPASNRYSVALGFGTLAVAQVLHGGAFSPSDAAPEVVAIRALAYALVLIGVVGALRPATAAGAGITLHEPLVLAPAGAALLVALASFSVAGRAADRTWRRLGLGMLFVGVAEALLVAARPGRLENISGGEFDRFAYASHGIKTVGFLSIAAWLWSAARSSIRVRYVASFGALLVAVVLALSTTLAGVISNSVQTGELDRIGAQAASAADAIALSQATDLTRQVRQAADSAVVAKRLVQGADPEAIAAQIAGSGIWDADVYMVDPRDGNPGFNGEGPKEVARGRPGNRTTKLGQGLVLGVLGSDIATEVLRPGGTGISAGVARFTDVRTGRGHVAVIAAAKVDRNGRNVGALIFARWVDTEMLQGVSAPLQANASVIVGDRDLVASDFRSAARSRDVHLPSQVADELSLGGRSSAHLTLGGSSFFNGYAPLSNDGFDVATLVLSTEAEVIAGTRSSVNRILFVVAMLVGAIALALASVSGSRITRPIQALTLVAAKVREGDLEATAEVSGADEVGQLGETFNEMTSSLSTMTGDLRRAAREEASLRARIETIIESMADGLVAVDADLNVLAFNREAEHLTGIPAEEALGRSVGEVLSVTDLQGRKVEIPIHSLEEGTSGGIYLRNRGRNPVPVAIASAVLRGDDDEIAGGVAVIRDMTREREIERMKSEFLANISHELRTPLTPIKGYAEILLRKEVPVEKRAQFVQGIVDSTARLERIVDLLVDFAAMEAGRMLPKADRIDVGEMLHGLAEKWKGKAPRHEVVTDLPASLPDVLGDERLLRRSIEEALDNAVKFSPDGGTISLEARCAAGNGSPGRDRVEVTIADQGIGISPDDLPRIFSDFQQLDGSETRTYGGLGLGLAYVRRIAQVHDGDVEVNSDVGAGTRLTITIPAARARRPSDD